MAGHRPLPRSLDPLAGESIAGYLLRLAHRLDLRPIRLAVLTGLTPASHPSLPANHLIHLPTQQAATVADATRLTPNEVADLCLSGWRHRYPALGLTYDEPAWRRTDRLQGMPRWIHTRTTRYCPHCLAGKPNPIEQTHGGSWRKLWRLPVVFGCTTHRRLLEHTCPCCHQPASLVTTPILLFPRPGLAGLHPAQCRSPQPSHRRPAPVCGARLDHQPVAGQHATNPALPGLLAVQHRILTLLDHDSPNETVSLGAPANARQYFLDLRLLIALIRLSWPEARHQAPTWLDTDLIDTYIDQQRHLAETSYAAGHTPDPLTYAGRP